MKCLIWAAVSSKPQATEDKDSIPSQIATARQLIQDRDWHEVGPPAVVDGHTRSYIFLADAAKDMPEYQRVMDLAREGELDLLVCRGRDRLGRTDALIAQVEEYLAHHNCQVLSMAMPTRVLTPREFATRRDRTSIWLRAVERAGAATEMAELKDRHRTGMHKRVKRGLHPTRPPYGYRKDAEGVGQIHEEEAEVVRFIFERCLAGLSFAAIAKAVRQFSCHVPATSSSVNHILENGYYMGTVGYSQRDNAVGEPLTAKGLHEPIIDDATFHKVEEELRIRKEQGKRLPHSMNPLTGFVICGYCGGRMKSGCGRANPYRPYVCDAPGCVRNSIRIDLLEDEFIAYLTAQLNNIEGFVEEVAASLQNDTSSQELDRLQKAVAQKRQALSRWQKDYEAGYISRDEYYSHRTRLEEELEPLCAKCDELEKHVATFDAEDFVASLEKLSEADIRHAWMDSEWVRAFKVTMRSAGLCLVVKDKKAELSFVRH